MPSDFKLLAEIIQEILGERRRRRRKKKGKSRRRHRQMYWPIGGVYTLGISAFDAAESGGEAVSEALLLAAIQGILRESSPDSVLKIIDGKVWGRLDKHPELIVTGTRILFDPPERKIEDIRRTIKHVQGKLNAWSSKERSQTSRAKKAAVEQQGRLNLIDHVGQFGEIAYASVSKKFFTITFEDGFTPSINIPASWVWVMIGDPSPDFRPDETLPEDYYAL